MSDILIKGMEMPTYDGVFPCRLKVENGVAKLEIDYIITAFMDERKVYPLVPVLPHGRLIDADAVAKMVLDSVNQEDAQGFMFTKIICQILKDAPTIIPAEEGE